MPNLPKRLLLPLALALALGACSDEPEADKNAATPAEPAAAAPAPTATPAKAPPAQKALPVASTAFERALRSLTNGGNVRFESEATLADGSTQYASGAGNVLNASFVVRTLPKADAQYDGTWLLQGGRYLKESGASFDISALSPAAAVNMYAAISTIPQSDSTLAGDAPKLETVGGIQCSARQVDLSKDARLATAYKSLEVCVEETEALLIRLSAEMQTGERLQVSFSGHGEPVQLPQTQVKDWSQEYPLR